VLRKIFEPKGDKVTRKWRKLHNKELRDLYSLPSMIRMINATRMVWAGNVEFWLESQKERDHWEDQEVGG
jgi:hypothetical protein